MVTSSTPIPATAAAPASAESDASSIPKHPINLSIETATHNSQAEDPHDELTTPTNVQDLSMTDPDDSFAATLEKMSQDADAILDSIIQETNKPTATKTRKVFQRKKRPSPKAIMNTYTAAVVTPKSSNKSSTRKMDLKGQDLLVTSALSDATPTNNNNGLSVPDLHKNELVEDHDTVTDTENDESSLITDHDMTDDDRSILTLDDDEDDDRSLPGSSTYRAKVRQLSRELQTAEQEFLRQQHVREQRKETRKANDETSSKSFRKEPSTLSATIISQPAKQPRAVPSRASFGGLQSALVLITICAWGIIVFVLWSIWVRGVSLMNTHGVLTMEGFW